MTILLATLFGLALWITLWAIGAKAFDAFMLTMLIVLGAAAWHIIKPYLPGNKADQPPPGS